MDSNKRRKRSKAAWLALIVLICCLCMVGCGKKDAADKEATADTKATQVEYPKATIKATRIQVSITILFLEFLTKDPFIRSSYAFRKRLMEMQMNFLRKLPMPQDLKRGMRLGSSRKAAVLESFIPLNQWWISYLSRR